MASPFCFVAMKSLYNIHKTNDSSIQEREFIL